jgi:hypothetical protein
MFEFAPEQLKKIKIMIYQKKNALKRKKKKRHNRVGKFVE